MRHGEHEREEMNQRRAKKQKLYGAIEPHRCVILAVDPSLKRSGWAVFLDGDLVAHGTAPAEHIDRVREVVLRALEVAETYRRKVVLVGEEWGRGGRMASVRTAGGLGAAWGTWKAVALSTPLGKSKIARSRILRVPVATWRARFGLNSRMGTEWLKKAAVRVANARLGLELKDDAHDEAEALLMGVWATRAGEVGRVLAPATATGTRKVVGA